jgi:hypothetical protein
MNIENAPITALLMTAGEPNSNGHIYTSKALKKMAKENPKKLRYEHGHLFGIYYHEEMWKSTD